MVTNVKIAGTTFHQIPNERYLKVDKTYEHAGVPCAKTKAVLVPEPENEYDPEAVKVMVPLDDGEAFHIGFLPKESLLKTAVAKTGKSYMAEVEVKNFTRNSPQYSPSWIITEVAGL